MTYDNITKEELVNVISFISKQLKAAEEENERLKESIEALYELSKEKK